MDEQQLEKTSEIKPLRDERGRLLPGYTANPHGKPKGAISIVAKIKEKLKTVPDGQKKEYLDMLVDKIFEKSIVEGDTNMIKDIVDRIDGKPKQETDITISGKPVPLLNELHNNNSDKKDIDSEQTN